MQKERHEENTNKCSQPSEEYEREHGKGLGWMGG